MTPKQQQRLNRVVWFEIPAVEIDRARRFYQSILNIDLKLEEFGSTPIVVFPYEPPAVSGAIVRGENLVPASTGTVIYLNADPSLDAVLGRVDAAGGAVVLPRTALPGDMGVYAWIRDTEGNVVGLHALS